MSRAKVFGIGFHRTGTTSLGSALELLGYRVCGPVGIRDPRIAERAAELAFEKVDDHDAFQDNPWPLLYRELDERYPHSRFVLTLRPAQAWIRSVVRHFGSHDTPMRRWIYGVGHPEGHERAYVERYERHNAEVVEYFRKRPRDLLVLRLTEGQGWDALCPFLGAAVPPQAFPHRNRSGLIGRAARHRR